MDSVNDYQCSICLNVLGNPVQTACLHLFCQLCLMETGDENNETTCPLCRNPIYNLSGLQVDNEMNRLVAKLFPKDHSQRMNEINRYVKEQEKYQKLMITYGNTDIKVEDPQESISDPEKLNTDQWCCFVNLKLQKGQKQSDYISRVEFLLDPTFSNPKVVVFREPYQVSRIGYDVFQIPIKIYWKEWLNMKEPTQLFWNLQFDEPLRVKLSSVKIEKQIILNNQSKKNKVFRF